MTRLTYGLPALALLLGCHGQPAGDADARTTETTAQALSNAQQWTKADDDLIAPVWSGDNDKGSLYSPLWRGANSAIEDLVWAPPDGDCSGVKGTVLIQWDSSKNTVHFVLKYKGMPVSPVIHRTEGVDFWDNPFHQAAKDLDKSAYKFWVIFDQRVTVNFWYDATTLQLQGSDYDFPSGPPAGTFPISIPVFTLFPSALLRPDASGFIYHEWTIPYDVVQVEGGYYGVSRVTFVPTDLCQAVPGQPGLGQARPYARWLPPGSGPSWQTVLRGGLQFDTSIDDDSVQYPGGQLPYVYSNIAFVSNTPAVNGGIPNGGYFLLPASIETVSPLIIPSPGGGSVKGCTPFVATPHVTGPNFCQ